jgi:hypothetical protein
LLRTHSDHILLESDRREALLEEVAALIDRHGGVLGIEYVTSLCLARALGRGSDADERRAL